MTTQLYNSANVHKAPRIVGTGLVALDVLVCDQVQSGTSSLGGSAGNVLAILAYLGWRAVPVARLGNDGAAIRIAAEFEALNADTRFIVRDESTPTPIVYQWPGDNQTTHKFSFCCPICGTKRSFLSVDENATLCNSVLSEVKTTDVFYFDRVTPWALSLAKTYRSRNAMVVFEPSTIQSDHDTFQEAIYACNVLKYADDRIDELKSFDREQVDIEIKTEGAKGLRFKLAAEKDSGWHFLEALSVPKISDTAGAGDWCTSGFLHYLSSKRTNFRDSNPLGVANALRYGQALAALNCTQSGARGLTKQFESALLKNILENLFTSALFTANYDSLWNHVAKDLYSTLDKKSSQAPERRLSEKANMINDLCCKSVEI
jgi:fructokinase